MKLKLLVLANELHGGASLTKEETDAVEVPLGLSDAVAEIYLGHLV